MAIIFEDDHLQVLHAPGTSPYAVASFNARDQRANGRDFWARVLADRYGVECVGFVTKGPNWFPAASMAAAATALASRRSKPLLGYGHSMGGYACLRYAALLGLEGGIASAPLLSIAPNHRFDDLRYAADYDPLLHRDMPIRAEHLAGRLILAYDPRFPADRQHAEAILHLSPRVEALPLPHLRHRAALALKPASVLLPAFEAIRSGVSLAPVRVSARRNARAQPLYRIHLARALLMSGRAATARRLLEALAEPLEADAALERRLYLARACARTGAVPEAVALLQELVGRRPENPAYRHELHRIRSLRAA
ncbi:tetratricopeptide repeat protein [Roseicella aerolata]|uniref:Alpha/beta hydrolase n=1 Tax=Roseicella aerolata TaxID=2883479 RepID=A0A9X1IDP3_9PROT|nr:hypothetical protein [Roseicella aerolata]MCB4822512.1 hypothetical protein [Roseicella aerolata]